MTIISLLIALFTPIQSYWWGEPIQTHQTCWSAYLVRMQQCRTQYPDATSLQRAVCEADAAGQYTACIEGLP